SQRSGGARRGAWLATTLRGGEILLVGGRAGESRPPWRREFHEIGMRMKASAPTRLHSTSDVPNRTPGGLNAMTVTRTRLRVGLRGLLALGAACKREPTAPGEAVSLVGQGATFPVPLYQRWIDKYADPAVAKIEYQATGSSAGIEAIATHEADFAGTD